MSLVTHLRDNTVLLFRLHQQFTFIGSSDKRLFHIHMDAKLHRLYTNREITIARNFLRDILSPPKNFIKEIMYQSGFMNRSHFYKEFTKRMGVVPKDYRLHNKK